MLNLDNLFPLEIDNAHWITMDASSVTRYMAVATTITTFAAGILGSAYLAYKSPGKWWLSTLSIGIVNLYTLPKVLRYGSPTMIKIALVANLTALSCLSLGCMGTACYSLCRLMVSSCKTYQFSSALFSAFLMTGLMGYGFPFFQSALQKAYRFLHDAKAQDRLAVLYDHFHHRPELGLGFLQGNFWQSFVLHLSFFKPSFILGFCQVFDISLPDYVWPIAVAASDATSLDNFNQMLDSMEELGENLELEGESLSEEMKKNYSLGLSLALKSLNDNELPLAFQAVMARIAKFVPDIVLEEQFLEIFQEENLLGLADELIAEFLSLANSWDDLMDLYDEMSMHASQFKAEIQSLNLQQMSEEEEEALNQRYEDLILDVMELRTEIEKTYSSKRIWQGLGAVCKDATELPFERSLELLPIIQDQGFLKQIEDTYRELMTGIKHGGGPTLTSELQFIKNKLATLHEESEEETSAIMYLGMCRGFVQGDYDDLQSWLSLDSPHDLEEAMEKIGLATEEDLYEHNILLRGGPAPSKNDIRNNLYAFIKKAPKPLLASQVQSEEEIDETSDLGTTMDKVTRVIYYAISSGLILAPVLIHPYAGGAGFAIGLCFFTLEHFGVPGTETIAEVGVELIDAFPLGHAFRSLLNRRVFSISTRRREAANHFIQSDFFEKMRIINLQILASLFLTTFTIKSETPFIGSFVQGVALSKEVVELIN